MKLSETDELSDGAGSLDVGSLGKPEGKTGKPVTVGNPWCVSPFLRGNLEGNVSMDMFRACFKGKLKGKPEDKPEAHFRGLFASSGFTQGVVFSLEPLGGCQGKQTKNEPHFLFSLGGCLF